MRYLFPLVILITIFTSFVLGGQTPPRCQELLQKYFVDSQNNGIQISYMDPNGKVVYSRGNSMTAYLFSQDLSNTDSYVALSSANEDCFDNKVQPFSDKKTVEGFYDSRSFRITRGGQVTINNEGASRIFNITDCSTTVFSGYSNEGRLYAFHIMANIKYQLLAGKCGETTTDPAPPTSSPTIIPSTTGGGGSDNVCNIIPKIENTWIENGVYYSYIVVKIENVGHKDIKALTINGGVKIRDTNSVWGADTNSNGDMSIPKNIVIESSKSYTFNYISIGKDIPQFKILKFEYV